MMSATTTATRTRPTVTSSSPHRGVLLAAVGTLAVSLTACSGSSGGSAASTTGATSSVPAGSSAPSSTAVAGQPFGSDCAQVPATGPGSFAGMATEPVGTAALSNPVLSTLVAAVQKANLVDSLNNTQNITVLAPANPAFQTLPPDALNAVLNDTPRLTAVLTHHVIPGRLTPAQLAGEHTTVADDAVTIAGSGASFTISGDQTLSGQPATVVCGNVQTANATVYVIDQVLKPAKG
jgi:uncharacterized surface protein with fasciclin (FAS1) repeats